MMERKYRNKNPRELATERPTVPLIKEGKPNSKNLIFMNQIAKNIKHQINFF